MDLRTDRQQLFALLAHPDTTSRFFERVAEDVDVVVEADERPVDLRPGRGEEVVVEADPDREAQRVGEHHHEEHGVRRREDRPEWLAAEYPPYRGAHFSPASLSALSAAALIDSSTDVLAKITAEE